MNTISNGQKIKAAINKDEEILQRHQKLEAFLKEYVTNCKDPYRFSCAGLVDDVLGGTHRAVEEIQEMKATVTDLFVLLTNPDIAAKFKEVRSGWSCDFADHLRRILVMLDWANNDLAIAEMALYELDNFTLSENAL
ncbi:MAG: hypothetical protein EOP48_32135, partial [Sphingobacteriales bacterium]